MSKLFLVRHGQTVLNRRKIVQGWFDSPLTELGIAQAELARDWLDAYLGEHNIRFDHAYASSLNRACDTCEILMHNALDYSREKGLKELYFGALEGATQEVLLPGSHADYGDYLVQFGGESMEDVKVRVNDCLTNIMLRGDHENVLAVSHGAACLAFNLYWLDTSDVKVDSILGNCTIYVFDFDRDAQTFNCIEAYTPDDSHLPGGGRLD